MEEYRLMRYVYETIEEALRNATSIQGLFLDEGIYESHTIVFLQNGRFMVNFKVAA